LMEIVHEIPLAPDEQPGAVAVRGNGPSGVDGVVATPFV
jgi:hypothetical protein